MLIGYYIINLIVMLTLVTFSYKNLFSIKNLYKGYLHRYLNLSIDPSITGKKKNKNATSSTVKANFLDNVLPFILGLILISNFSIILSQYLTAYFEIGSVDTTSAIGFILGYNKPFHLGLIAISLTSALFAAKNVIFYEGIYDETLHTSKIAHYIIKRDLVKSYNHSVADAIATFYIRGRKVTDDLEFITVGTDIAELLITSKHKREILSSLSNVMGKSENISIIAASLTLINDDKTLVFMLDDEEKDDSVDKAYSEKLRLLYAELLEITEISEDMRKEELIKNLERGIGF